MKKWAVSVFLIAILLVSVPAYAVVVTPPPDKAVPSSTKSIDTNNVINPPPQNIQPNRVMPNLRQKMANHPRLAKKVINFRRNQQKNQCFMGGPKILRWIGMGIKFVAILLFWILLIVLLVLLIKWAMNPHHMMHCWKNNSALDILKERLVKGDITSEQYDELKAKLS